MKTIFKPLACFLGLLVLLGNCGVLEAQDRILLEKWRVHLIQNPRDVGAMNAYGIELAKLNDLHGAIAVWRKGIDIDPAYVHLYNNIGGALRRLGFLKEAEEWYLISLKVKPTYWTWYNLGLLEMDLKKNRDAIRAFKEALTLCPSFVLAQEYMLKLERDLERQAVKPATRIPLPPVSEEQVELPLPPAPESESEPVRVQSVPVEPSVQKKSVFKKNPSVSKPPEPELVTVPKEQVVPPKKRQTEIIPLGPLAGDSGGPVFFTFDGGADADGIPDILEALRVHQVKATFFLTGTWVENYPDLAIQILGAGHEIANHSMSHKEMAGWGKDKIAAELAKTEDVFKRVLGRPAIPYFRFPFGDQNARVEGIVKELGYHPVYWDIDTLDWKEVSVSSIFSKVSRKLKPGAVILMHCGSKSGAKALSILLDMVMKRGYKPIPLSSFDARQIAAISLGSAL